MVKCKIDENVSVVFIASSSVLLLDCWYKFVIFFWFIYFWKVLQNPDGKMRILIDGCKKID